MAKRFFKIYLDFRTNPLIWFSFVWSSVLICYSLFNSSIYPKMNLYFLLLFSVLIIFSLCISGLINLKGDTLFGSLREPFSIKNLWRILGILYCIFLGEIAYSKSIPLFSVLISGDTSSYVSFGIPIVSGINISLFFTLFTYASFEAIFTITNRKAKIQAMGISLLCLLRFVLMFSRGLFAFALLIFAFLLIVKKKPSIKGFVFFLTIAIISSMLFGFLGNIRMGYSFYDSAYINNIAGLSLSRYNPFSWVLVYVLTPLGNLLSNYKTSTNANMLFGLQPDFLSSFLGISSPKVILPIRNLNVSTFFVFGYAIDGYWGIILQYIELILIINVILSLSKRDITTYVCERALLSAFIIISIFTNLFVSANSYFLPILWVLILSRYSKNKNVFVLIKA